MKIEPKRQRAAKKNRDIACFHGERPSSISQITAVATVALQISGAFEEEAAALAFFFGAGLGGPSAAEACALARFFGAGLEEPDAPEALQVLLWRFKCLFAI